MYPKHKKGAETIQWKIIYNPSHWGHEKDSSYIRLPQETKDTLYDQVKVGVPINRIMEALENQHFQTGAITCAKKKF